MTGLKEKDIRCFVAIEIPLGVRTELEKMIDGVKMSGADVKWASQKNMHITLKFLGNISEEKALAIAEEMKTTLSGQGKFFVNTSALDVFPKWEDPRILWVGLDDAVSRITSVQKVVEDIALKHGIPKEDRAFSAHITLGRVRSAHKKKELQECAKSAVIKPMTVACERVVLFKSVLSSRGPIYTPISTVIL